MLMKDSSSSSSWSLSPLHPGLWYCRDCFEAQLISDMSSLVYKYDLDEDRKNEFKDEEIVFRRKHDRHRLLPLKKKKDRCFMDRPAWDPLRTAYEEVTDGKETFILKVGVQTFICLDPMRYCEEPYRLKRPCSSRKSPYGKNSHGLFPVLRKQWTFL